MSHLFTPIALRGLDMPNRIVVAPMCQYSAIDGVAQDWHLIHYGSLAASGPGMIVLEATAVAPEGRISPACLGLWNSEGEAALARLVAALKKVGGSRVTVQLNHAGRKADGGWPTVAPSAVPFDDGSPE
ncbi:MAG: oxidoreductase, partial [Alphaproteobacteria bacterium]|nr:oxidoreductase [Alphaproteobacteria bacterium]